jgi:phosphopantothenoylcysteine decarboxylase/phosphopantothenate--cysteine ligase
VVVAPATANLIAKMANGIADDLASTTLMATDKPVLIAPAMNVRMWQHPATVRNVATLLADGVTVTGPGEGAMACGEFGPGRMAEPEEIAAAVAARLDGGSSPMAGRKILVTSGPTYEAIDPVRFIGNRSSGKQGHAIAAALAQRGAHVTLVSGPTGQPDPAGVSTVHVESAVEMMAACEAALPADAAICAAAVADWRVAKVQGNKIKKTEGGQPPALAFTENPDILASLCQRRDNRPRLVVGFAAETDNVVKNATAKRQRKGCDWLVANDVSTGTGTFGGEANTVHLISASGVEDWPTMTKTDVASRLADRIAQHFSESESEAAQ